MTRRTAGPAGIVTKAGIGALLCLAALPALGTTTEWRFRVLLGDSEIGEHHFRLEQRPEGWRLHSQARMNVRLLGINAFSYVHEATEHWQGDCLDRMQSRTDRNGRTYAVTGERGSDGFEVRTLESTTTLPACVMSFAYWNPKILSERQLLNPQNGEFVEVSVEDKGVESLVTGGSTVRAKRYSLVGRKLRIDVWYSPEGRWVGLESLTDSGQRLRYVLA